MEIVLKLKASLTVDVGETIASVIFKGVSSITYNPSNETYVITVGNINYTYDATEYNVMFINK